MDEDQQQSTEDLLRERNQVWLDTSKVNFGLQQNQHKEWITTETLGKIETRRKLKDKINGSRTRADRREVQSQYKKANQEVRKDHRRHKFIDLTRVETAAKQLTKTLAGKKSSTSKTIKDKHGNALNKQGRIS